MAENKRRGSFRKLFPFFSKSKEKNTSKDSCQAKLSTENAYVSNHIQSSRPVFHNVSKQSESEDRIYENLSSVNQNDNESHGVSSYHSSSSTLVSESIKNTTKEILNDSKSHTSQSQQPYAARPQVPRKPLNELEPIINNNEKSSGTESYQYPKVYYHSIEKFTNNLRPSETTLAGNSSQTTADFHSVGAQIKKVSTKFLISPKKEAEVRTIQPTRARSLSFSNNNMNQKKYNISGNLNNINPKKTYNYSAPTSPMPVNTKNPVIPKTKSPYESVRKKLSESEGNNKPQSNVCLAHGPLNTQIKNKLSSGDIYEESVDKEKTRQKVEAFYWKSLKEMKEKEDEYFLRQALKSTVSSHSPIQTPQSNHPLPYPNVMKCNSLPRNEMYQCGTQPPIHSLFRRMAPERRTDSCLEKRSSNYGSEIIYRNPEKLRFQMSPMNGRLTPTCQSYKVLNPLTKRVSFEEQIEASINNADDKKMDTTVRTIVTKPFEVARRSLKCPPRPPMRTTSVSDAERKCRVVNNKLHPPAAGFSLCSESESGSEAGEIQRILQSNAHKGKFICFSVL